MKQLTSPSRSSAGYVATDEEIISLAQRLKMPRYMYDTPTAREYLARFADAAMRSEKKETLTADEAKALYSYRKAELAELMSDISEELWAAGWLIGTEYRLWTAITDPDDTRIWGMGEIDPKDIARLRHLSEKVNGWWIWEEGFGRKFVSLDEWAAIRESNTHRQESHSK